MPIGIRHQAEPWVRDGRRILSAARKPVATTIYPADARRIVAAVNSLAAVPTALLETGLIREVLGSVVSADASDLKAARRWLDAAGRGVARPRGKAGSRRQLSPTGWPAAAVRIAAAVRAVAGVPTAMLESEAVREILAAVALAPPSDLRAVEKWLTTSGGRRSRRKPARPARGGR